MSKTPQEFVWHGAAAEEVIVTGQFDEWKSTGKCTKGSDGVHKAMIDLAPGKYLYKFGKKKKKQSEILLSFHCLLSSKTRYIL